MEIKYSSLESARFGFNIYRGSAKSISAEPLNAIITDNNPDVIIVRFPGEEQENVYKLLRLPYTVLQADTLVYYTKNLNNPDNYKPRNYLEVSTNNTNEREIYLDMVSTIFPSYKNHYKSNPLFKDELMLDGYKEWAEGYLNDPAKDVHLFYLDNEPTGFLASVSHTEKEAELVLSGVYPKFHSKGLYTDYIHWGCEYYKAKGADKIRLSTQIINYAVQKAWVKLGFSLTDTYITLHLIKPSLLNLPK